jgi:4-amino-4-deoxy-L-arabinose transferase-like glycosyltransferase
MRTTHRAAATAIVFGAAALRIPAYVATRHLSFDDGVYGASAVAMRHGGLPFRDVFSSQGPLFLPLVWLFDLLGLRTLDAPRLLAVASGLALVLATWSAARAMQLSTGATALAAGLAGTSGSVLWVTGPLTSDAPALALAAWAVTAALWYRRSPSLRWAVAAGVLLGAALSIKSLLLAAGLPVAWVLLPNRRHLAAAVAAAGVLSLAAALPWGLGNVWDQAFKYHLEAAGSRTPVRNLRKAASTLGDRDLPLVLAAAVGLVGVWSSRARAAARPAEARSTGAGLIVTWLAATIVVLALEHPLWRNHVAHLIPAAAVLVGVAFDRLRPVFRRALVAVALVAVPYHVVHLAEVLWPAPPGPALAAAQADLRALPPGALVISDDPGVVWRAGRRTPDDLVDTSILRIESRRLTAPSLRSAAAVRPVCAVLVWSHRFGDLSTLPALLEDRGYRPTARYGGPKVLYTRSTCGV